MKALAISMTILVVTGCGGSTFLDSSPHIAPQKTSNDASADNSPADDSKAPNVHEGTDISYAGADMSNDVTLDSEKKGKDGDVDKDGDTVKGTPDEGDVDLCKIAEKNDGPTMMAYGNSETTVDGRVVSSSSCNIKLQFVSSVGDNGKCRLSMTPEGLDPNYLYTVHINGQTISLDSNNPKGGLDLAPGYYPFSWSSSSSSSYNQGGISAQTNGSCRVSSMIILLGR